MLESYRRFTRDFHFKEDGKRNYQNIGIDSAEESKNGADRR